MTAYDIKFENNQVGQVDDTSIRRIDSAPTNSNLQFGVCVTLDSFGGSYGVEPWAANTFAFGITTYDPNQIDGFYHLDRMASVLTFGRITVLTIDAVEPGESAYVYAGGVIGGVPAVITPNDLHIGYFLTSADAGGKVLLQFTPNGYN